MQLAFEVSFYAFLLLILFGLFLTVWFFRWIFGGKDILAVFPHKKALPTPALDEVKQLFKKMREYLPKASPVRREQLLSDLNRMERLIEEVAFRIERQQMRYHELCEEREGLWHQIKQAYDSMSPWQKAFGKSKDMAYQELLHRYNELTKLIEETEQRFKFQGELLLAEVRERPVFQQNFHLFQKKQKKSTEAEETIDQPSPESEAEEAVGGQSSPQSQTDEPQQARKQPQKTTTNRQSITQANFKKLGNPIKNGVYTDTSFELAFAENSLLTQYEFEQCAFRGVHFKGMHQYNYCQFRNVDFSGAYWLQETAPHGFNGCQFVDSLFNKCRITYTTFTGCHFNRIQWTDIKLYQVSFINCTFENVSWQGMDLSYVKMSQDMLESLDFSGCLKLPSNHSERQNLQSEKKANHWQTNQTEDQSAMELANSEESAKSINLNQ